MKTSSVVKSYIVADDNLVVTIPVTVRRKMKLKPGTKFLVRFNDKTIIYERLEEE